MPYFVYRIIPGPTQLTKELEYQEVFDKFKDAKVFAREQRVEQAEGDPATVKVIFADNQLHAEELLMEKREPRMLDGNDEPI